MRGKRRTLGTLGSATKFLASSGGSRSGNRLGQLGDSVARGGFLPGILSRRQSGGGSGGASATSHAIAGSSATTSIGSAYSSRGGWDVERAVSEGLERVIWVLRCVDAIATNQAKLPIVLRVGNPKDGTIVQDTRLNRLLNIRSNPYETAQQFRYRFSGNALLSKRGVFIERVQDQMGIDRELHILPSHLVEPVPGEVDEQGNVEFVDYFRMMTPQGEARIPREKVIWIRLKPHPTDPYLQLTPLTAAGIAADTDFLARLFNRNFLLNDGRPGLLINVQGQVSQTDAEELKRRFSGGPYGAGRTSVIEAEGISVNDLGASPRDLQWLEAIRGSKDDILLSFGTPESVLGNASGRTYDNADAEKENWWEETVQGHCDGFTAGLDALTGSEDDDRFLSMDYDGVDVLQRRKRARHDKLKEEYKDGLITIDEYLEATGRERWNVPGTRSLFLPTGVVIARNPEDQTAVAQLPVVGIAQQQGLANGGQDQSGLAAQGSTMLNSLVLQRARQLMGSQPPAIEAQPQQQPSSRFYQQQQQQRQQPAYQKSIEAQAYDGEDGDDFFEDSPAIEGEIVWADPHADVRDAIEGDLAEVIDQWTATQLTVIPTRLDHVKTKQYTRHWAGELPGNFNPEKGLRDLNVKYAVDQNRWTNELESSMDRLMHMLAEKQLRRAATDMGREGITRAMHAKGLGAPQGRSTMLKVFGSRDAFDSALSGLLTPLQAVVRDAAQRQSQKVAERIKELDDAGASLAQIKQEVNALIGTRSSWRTQLSRFITTSILEGAQHAAYRRAGSLVEKTWRTQEDERVRHTHAALDGTSRPVDKNFKVGKSWMMHPVDPKGAIGEVAGCRCWNSYDIAPEMEAWFVDNAY